MLCAKTREAADQITRRLNTDDAFKELKGKTINLHTNLKGKVKKIGRGAQARFVFAESEKEISDEDLEALRELSRNLDHNSSPYHCIVSVLMLREGWDVRNVTTIVPLRAYTSKAAILPEQTLGRGLRRMTPPGSQGANETVTVVEHPAFASLYQDQLAQEGLPIEVTDIDDVPATTVSIYPDEARKDFKELEFALPTLTAGHRITPKLEGLALDDIKAEFKKYKALPLGGEAKTEIDYEGRHLFTGEIVERMKIDLPLLDSGVGAVSYYIKQLEQICKIKNLHTAVAPLLQSFLEEVLFEEKTTLYDGRLINRLGSSDVSEHIRAVFVPLIRARTTKTEERRAAGTPHRLSEWKPFQVTHSERRPALEAAKTLFNLVPCNRELETAFTKYADRASDVSAFAKNAGPQCLRIDYLASGGRLAFYTPDFFVRTSDGHCYLVETKGREDRDVPTKARAAMAWCDAGSTDSEQWEYLYIPQGVFERHRGSTLRELADTCRPALQNLVDTESLEERYPLLAPVFTDEGEERPEIATLVSQETLDALPTRYRKSAEQAAMLFRFLENKEGINFAPVFTGLLGSLDEAAKGLIVRKLEPELPADVPSQKAWFDIYLPRGIDKGKRGHYERMAQNLKRTLVFGNGISPLGLLRSCLDYALNDNTKINGVYEAVKTTFRFPGGRKLLENVSDTYEFRNTRVAHQEEELADAELTERELRSWVETLRQLTETR